MSRLTVWQKNILHGLSTNDVLILHGNIRDLYIYFDGGQPYEIGFEEMITRLLDSRSYTPIQAYDPYSKVRTLSIGQAKSFQVETTSNFKQALGFGGDRDVILSRIIAGLEESSEDNPQVWMLNYMHNVLPYRSNYSQEDSMRLIAFQRMMERISPKNKLILCYISDTLTPIEFSENIHRIAMVKIPMPDFDERKLFLEHRIRLSVRNSLNALDQNTLLKVDTLSKELSKQTDGLALTELSTLTSTAIAKLKTLKQENSDLTHLTSRHWEEVVDAFKFGESKDFFKQISAEQLGSAKDFFIRKEGVQGQEYAVNKATEMLLKARTNVNALLQGNSNAPRGVLFFCGPSGVGKTFLSKKIAKFVFGSEDAFHRFDMSEYQQDYTVSKLIGSPPGYVGYERGGLLTNAVSEKPFSVILFDEIEKAHPKILDIFLQILSDGRLTDSRGQVVFFSQSIIIFTSNIGTRSSLSAGSGIRENILLQQARDEKDPEQAVRRHFISCVRNFFKDEISRPELLNRFGNNIIPFNYLENRSVLETTVEHYLKNLEKNFEAEYNEQALKLEIQYAPVTKYIVEKFGTTIKEFGGRAVLNILDDLVLPKLAACLLRHELTNQGQSNVIQIGINQPESELQIRLQ